MADQNELLAGLDSMSKEHLTNLVVRMLNYIRQHDIGGRSQSRAPAATSTSAPEMPGTKENPVNLNGDDLQSSTLCGISNIQPTKRKHVPAPLNFAGNQNVPYGCHSAPPRAAFDQQDEATQLHQSKRIKPSETTMPQTIPPTRAEGGWNPHYSRPPRGVNPGPGIPVLPAPSSTDYIDAQLLDAVNRYVKLYNEAQVAISHFLPALPELMRRGIFLPGISENPDVMTVEKIRHQQQELRNSMPLPPVNSSILFKPVNQMATAKPLAPCDDRISTLRDTHVELQNLEFLERNRDYLQGLIARQPVHPPVPQRPMMQYHMPNAPPGLTQRMASTSSFSDIQSNMRGLTTSSIVPITQSGQSIAQANVAGGASDRQVLTHRSLLSADANTVKNKGLPAPFNTFHGRVSTPNNAGQANHVSAIRSTTAMSNAPQNPMPAAVEKGTENRWSAEEDASLVNLSNLFPDVGPRFISEKLNTMLRGRNRPCRSVSAVSLRLDYLMTEKLNASRTPVVSEAQVDAANTLVSLNRTDTPENTTCPRDDEAEN